MASPGHWSKLSSIQQLAVATVNNTHHSGHVDREGYEVGSYNLEVRSKNGKQCLSKFPIAKGIVLIKIQYFMQYFNFKFNFI